MDQDKKRLKQDIYVKIHVDAEELSKALQQAEKLQEEIKSRKLVDIKKFIIVNCFSKNDDLNLALQAGYEIIEIYHHDGTADWKPHTIFILGKYK